MTNGPPVRPSGLVDALLLFVVLLWAVNYSVVKAAITEMPPLAFNTIRLALSSLLLVGLSYLVKREAPPRADWGRLALLGIVGHTVYQLCFILGLESTTVTHSSLLLGTTPVVVALLSVVLGAERPTLHAWAGIALSLAGVYLILGRSAGASVRGDVLTIAATLCWSLYTVGSAPLLSRHGPLQVTATTMALGTLFYIPFGASSLAHLSLRSVPAATWARLVFSSVFALGIAYTVWYYAVARIGATRTAVYSNLTPVAATLISVVVFGERITPIQVAGAATIFTGVYWVRKAPRRA